MMMGYPTCEHPLFEKGQGIGRLTLNRPERLNAVNERMRREMMAALNWRASEAEDWRAKIDWILQ